MIGGRSQLPESGCWTRQRARGAGRDGFVGAVRSHARWLGNAYWGRLLDANPDDQVAEVSTY